MNIHYNARDIKRFNETWNGYIEQQTLSKIIADIPLMALRDEAVKHVLSNNSNRDKTEDEAATDNVINTANNEVDTEQPEKAADCDGDTKVYQDGYEIAPILTLQYIEPDLLSTLQIKFLGDLNWSFAQFDTDDRLNMQHIAQHLTSPAQHPPVYNPPSTPFRIWRNPKEPCKPYSYPICMPVSAVALAAVQQHIDLSEYDFVSLRRSVKRILSFSPQLNTNFQMIDGVIYCEEVPICGDYFPFNYGYQLEIKCCCGDTAPKRSNECKQEESTQSSKHWPPPFRVMHQAATAADEDDVIAQERDVRYKQQEKEECRPVCKEGDYYHLVEVGIGDLKLLVCAEIDCVDKDGQPIELKFGSSDKQLSVWSQCILSGISSIIQADKTYQSLCTLVTNLQRYEMDNYFCSKPYQNAQLMVFYNVLKHIKQKLLRNSTAQREKEANAKGEDDMNVDDKEEAENSSKESVASPSSIWRLSRHRSWKDATLFEVDAKQTDLITKQQWKYINECKK